MRRFFSTLNVVAFFAAIATILVVVNAFAQRPELRSRIDATKTRAYSLSEQTMNMLKGLEGDWVIAVMVNQSETNRAVRRQVDEVLGRFTQASPNISIVRIDPTDPRTLGEYEAVLADLRMRYAETVTLYDEHLDEGQSAYEQLILFTQQQSGVLGEWVQIVQAEGGDNSNLQSVIQRAQTLSLIAEQGEEVLQEVRRARRSTDTQPIPDYETARSILAQALTNAANELYETAEAYGRWIQQGDMSMELRQFASANRSEYEQRAQQLAVVVDPLRHLPPLELSTIGRHLASGEGAVILGPDRAAVVPASQLFPMSNIRESGRGVVTFDQRFRGEQLISAAMRSLLVEHMPMVVFMHAEEGSWLRQRDRQIDLFGVGTMLSASRFVVEEWKVGASGAERPSPERGQPVVWVPIPPPQRAGIEPTRQELELISQVRRLIDDGEPVLLSVYPSLLPRYGQDDPWARLARPFGASLDTSRVIYESIRTAADETDVQRGQLLQRFSANHAIGRAVHGQQAHFSLPTVIAPSENIPEGVRQHVIASIEPVANRWLEPNWSADTSTLGSPGEEQRFHESKTIVMAASRPHPIERGEQRMMMVGSGGWMLTYISDAVVGVGGDRVALYNPGNHELMMASVAWLAGMDDLIAQSPTGQEVARLGEIDENAARWWFWLIVVIMPVACLALGLLTWGVRRN